MHMMQRRRCNGSRCPLPVGALPACDLNGVSAGWITYQSTPWREGCAGDLTDRGWGGCRTTGVVVVPPPPKKTPETFQNAHSKRRPWAKGPQTLEYEGHVVYFTNM